jgi:PAP2 superfamily
MKTVKIYSLLLITGVATLTTQCNKEVTDSEGLYPLQPITIDANAGTWQLIPGGPMTSVNQIALAAPSSVTSAAYLSELASIKTAQSELNSGQRKAIDYWSGGGILRWNQILRELVAEYNLPPAPRPDGSYVFPDSDNPFTDPEFPFSNPPYAARAYSYVAVAQYEALQAAWYYKYQYNRPAPYNVDNTIQALVPKTDLPSYPSEDAVMSGVAQVILSSLFPDAVEEITQKAGEQRNAALWSGKASASDISAGLAFGKSIAALFTARAAADGMKNAIGTQPQWDAFADSAIAHGQLPWKSLDVPPRPPMLPFFSQVKGWIIKPTDIVSIRPVAPPSTSSSEMIDQVNEVKYYSQNLTRERQQIVLKWADGAGTYTPPGHWNDIAEEYVRDARFSEVRAARAFALLNMSLHDAAVACWDAKYYYFNPRPTQLDEEIKTGTGIPNFPSYTSGHSTFSGAASTVLSYLFPADADYFSGQASEASVSRLYGAIHYRVDIENGLDHGKKVGVFTVSFAQQDGAN